MNMQMHSRQRIGKSDMLSALKKTKAVEVVLSIYKKSKILNKSYRAQKSWLMHFFISEDSLLI